MFAAPGNPGTASLATNLPIAATDIDRLGAAVRDHRIDLTIVGPEAPLAAGLADRLRDDGRAVFGPSAAAARLESSKAYAKEVMRRAGVPTAASAAFVELTPALDYIHRHAEPLVVKASGLAAGKGAVVCQTRADAASVARAMLAGSLGEAGRTIVIEDFLAGEELSVLALTDGERVVMLPPAQDHKRLGEGDTGPNTGGMGAYCPVGIASEALLARVRTDVFEPVLHEIAAQGAPYEGVLYAGLMILRDGTQKKGRVTKLTAFEGLKRQEVDEASAGEIVAGRRRSIREIDRRRRQVEQGDDRNQAEQPASRVQIHARVHGSGDRVVLAESARIECLSSRCRKQRQRKPRH